MARCNCAGGACACLIQGGGGIDVSGSGTPTNPYIISGTGSVAGALQVADTATINLSGAGAGIPGDPFVISGVATLTMMDLTNVIDTAPTAVGQVPTWTGTQFTFQTPAAAPAGSVATWASMDGDGSAPNPLRLATGTGADWTAAGFSGTPESAGTRLYQTGSAVSEVHGPPAHTTKRSSVVTTTNGALAAQPAPAFSAVVVASNVSILNDTARPMVWHFTANGGAIFIWSDDGTPTVDAFFAISEDGGAEQVNQRVFRGQGVGNFGSGWAFMGAARPLSGILAQGATKSFSIGLRYQRVNGVAVCNFSFHSTAAVLVGMTI